MIKNKINIFFTVITLIFVLFITYFTLDSSIRRYVYTKAIGSYKLYQNHIIGGHIFNKDFDLASKQILKYIEFSQKISKGKNSVLQGIIDVTELVTSKAYTQEEFNKMEKVYIKIDEITDDIYKNHIWLARSLSDNDQNESIKHLNKALRLSKSSEEAYREIIRLFSKNRKLISLFDNYCSDYFDNFTGGSMNAIGPQDDSKLFYGSSSIFSISRDENYSKLNPKFINNINKYNVYDFIFEKAKDTDEFNVVKSFFAGSKVSIKNIIIHNDKKNEIYIDDLIIHSLSSYILGQSKNEIIFLNATNEDDILKFNLNKTYKNISRITLELKLEKLALVNKSVCKNVNEN